MFSIITKIAVKIRYNFIEITTGLGTSCDVKYFTTILYAQVCEDFLFIPARITEVLKIGHTGYNLFE